MAREEKGEGGSVPTRGRLSVVLSVRKVVSGE